MFLSKDDNHEAFQFYKENSGHTACSIHLTSQDKIGFSWNLQNIGRVPTYYWV